MDLDLAHDLTPEAREILLQWFMKALPGFMSAVAGYYYLGRELTFTVGFFVYLLRAGPKLGRSLCSLIWRDGRSGREFADVIYALLPIVAFFGTSFALAEGSTVWSHVRDSGRAQFFLITSLCAIPVARLYFGHSFWGRVWFAYKKFRKVDQHVRCFRDQLIVLILKGVFVVWHWFKPFRMRIRAICIVLRDSKPRLFSIRAAIERLHKSRGMNGRVEEKGAEDQEASRDEGHREEGFFKHQKLDLDREIRLMKISRKTLFGVVNVEMIHVTLDATPDYDAISYTWGDALKIHHIRINRRRFLVPQNVFSIIQHRGSFWGTRFLWIDFLCINQEDNDEKTEQVELMTEIYSKASRVIVWLGDGRNSYLVNGLLDELAWIRLVNDKSTRGERIFKKYLDQQTSPKWLALLDLLNQPWFERVWVIQELAFAQRVDAIYGKKFIDWDILIQIMQSFENEGKKDAYWLLQSTDDFLASRPLPSGSKHALMMAVLREELGNGEARTLADLLMQCQYFKATRPEDKVFALLGLAFPASLGPLKVDYRKTVQEIYTQTAQHLLAEEDLVQLFHVAGIGNFRSVPDLPSWVPDWSTSPQSHPLSFLPNNSYRAAGHTHATICAGADRRTTLVSGINVDYVESIGSILEVQKSEENCLGGLSIQQRYLLWHDEALALSKKLPKGSYRGSMSLTEAFWRAIIGDKTSTQRPAPAIYAEYYRVWEESLRSDDSRWLLVTKAKDSDQSSDNEDLLEHMLQVTRFNLALRSGSGERRFCITKGGFMGLVLKNTQPGDEICLFSGGQTPFVLRGDHDTQPGTHQLVGEAYIHGMMDSEMWIPNGETKVFILL